MPKFKLSEWIKPLVCFIVGVISTSFLMGSKYKGHTNDIETNRIDIIRLEQKEDKRLEELKRSIENVLLQVDQIRTKDVPNLGSRITGLETSVRALDKSMDEVKDSIKELRK